MGGPGSLFPLLESRAEISTERMPMTIIGVGPSYILWEAVSSQPGGCIHRIPYFTGKGH